MRLKLIIILTVLFSNFCLTNLVAQTQTKDSTKISKKEFLKGLTKASEKDLSDKEIMLDGETIPVYSVKGKRIRGNEMMQVMISGNYVPDFYIDSNKEIKAAVLRIATKEEKLMIKEMETQINSEISAIGTDASNFSVTDINGNEYSLESLKGKIVVLNFWFVECKPCIEEMPELNRIVKKYKNKDIVFLAFATNEKTKIDKFLKRRDFLYNIIPDSEKIADKYNVSNYPTHIVLDTNSKIAYLTSGLGSTTIRDLENTIKSLIKK
ncbi:TlpA family protein disulfide reductase [Polaribacter batillariae]|uniref:TlpA family protein disulfide reductase n=1 Tax=Polaribacter batillariae TaxID=2808900 RepID=A0ABX7T105_9FLAO|nr:TlpA disulfide reductase family protein [Polaribacter batillariae]QTD38941.1 TlpA family protein disulfide reductase [Polaribacter batillariae]